ncbi:ankyrin repeat domain-containing protein [Algoriphagus hitonicola]|uniref:Ankyrin repeat-containing protein n=1 Tax=Algoriphagus hitonicola TaxID=435880 RepID=A0A1I2P431_9BACT|nr:ankyrin repeat domain-containing protein [Algoriphagus hitonicola]SFG10283.1 Ankyrin repeat-containing protein [Algoriphagus hitonicola]
MKAILESIQKGETDYLASRLSSNPELAKEKTESGIYLIQFAAYCKNQQAIDILKEYLSDLTLHESACIGELDGIKNTLSKNPELINDFSADGFTPLGLASYFGHIELVRLLLTHGAIPNIPSNNSFRVTPLHSACAISNYEIAERLLKNGAEVNAKQQNGVTPLHSAAHHGKKELVKLLLKYGADPNAKMDNGKSPMDLGRESGFPDLFEDLE